MTALTREDRNRLERLRRRAARIRCCGVIRRVDTSYLVEGLQQPLRDLDAVEHYLNEMECNELMLQSALSMFRVSRILLDDSEAFGPRQGYGTLNMHLAVLIGVLKTAGALSDIDIAGILGETAALYLNSSVEA